MKSNHFPMVSIITVCLNSENTIEKTITSVLEQTYENIEYIIVDGQSSDRTLDIIKKYETKIAKVVSEPDEGLYYAMNKGIAMATGEYIGIINSDDWYETYTVEEVVSCFKKTNADLVYGDIQVVEDGEPRLISINRHEDMRMVLSIPHPTMFVKKEMYDLYGKFDTQYKIAADLDLVLRLYYNGIHFECIKKVLASFRKGGLSTREVDACVKETVQVSLKHCNENDIEDKEYVVEQIDNSYKGIYFDRLIEENPEQIVDKILNIMKENNKKKVAIFGSGKWGRCVGKIMQDSRRVSLSCYIDNDLTKRGMIINNTKVFPPSRLEEFEGVVLILINRHSRECMEQVEKMNDSRIVCIDWKRLLNFV